MRQQLPEASRMHGESVHLLRKLFEHRDRAWVITSGIAQRLRSEKQRTSCADEGEPALAKFLERDRVLCLL